MSLTSKIEVDNICIIAGEASGDSQAALLVNALKEEYFKKYSSTLECWGSVGPRMREQGIEEIVALEEIAVMGYFSVIANYTKISKAYHKLKTEIIRRNPKVVILIDYPGFNLRMAKEIYQLGYTVIYHIPPKVWSHGESRLEILKSNCHLITSILPFETEYFKRNSVDSVFVGNPLKDNVNLYLSQHKQVKDLNLIGIIPGSRKSEIKFLLPILIESFSLLKEKFPNLKAAIPVAPTLSENFVKEISNKKALELNKSEEWITQNILFKKNSAYEIMSTANYAWVCSGTATLETGFFNTPMSVMYKVSKITAIIAKRIIKVKYVSLVNLCVDREIVPEYLQEKATADNLFKHAFFVLSNNEEQIKIKDELNKIKDMFPNNSAKNAALSIINCMEKYSNLSPEDKFRTHNIFRKFK